MAVKPDWLRVKAPQWQRIGNVTEVLRDLGLNTVCEEASCPNIGECFNQGTATFLIMGPACTRACPYCDIDFEKKPQALDPMEPINLGEAVRRMNSNMLSLLPLIAMICPMEVLRNLCVASKRFVN